MPLQKKTTFKNSAKAFVDYKPAEIRFNTQNLIVYHYKHPITNDFVRVRITVPKLKSKKDIKTLAHKMVFNINSKLATGWLPIYDNQETSDYKTFEYCSDLFISFAKKDIAKKNKRPDTLRSYLSFISMINKYITECSSIKMVFEIDKKFIINYLDWIYYERNNSARTFNNHLAFFNTFLIFCLNRGFVKVNVCTEINKLKPTKKTRQVLTNEIKVFVNKVKDDNFNYYILCMATYYCFIRRTELTKLKVKNIHLKDGYIFLQSEITKNKKDATITIPKSYYKILAIHLKKANNNDYLFSDDNFRTGKKQLSPKKISDTWTKIQKKHNFSNIYQFYSLKDTGITDLLKKGVPAIKVRDQARHYDIRITEGYTARTNITDKQIQNIDFEF